MTDKQDRTRKPPQSAPQQSAARWQDAGVISIYANTCTVSSMREEVVLNFGVNQAWERPESDVPVQATNRIILNPFTAKRLALLLGAVVQQYEARFGALGSRAKPDA